jgi:hypothetical protein
MSDLSQAQVALRTAAFVLAEQFGIGGAAWTVTRVVSGVDTPIGTWAGRIKKATKTDLAPTLPGVRVTVEEWQAIGASSAVGASTLRADDLLTSIADPALRFLVVGPVLVAGYARYQVERQR